MREAHPALVVGGGHAREPAKQPVGMSWREQRHGSEVLKGHLVLHVLLEVVLHPLHCLHPVSYTHLDVYKRQVLEGADQVETYFKLILPKVTGIALIPAILLAASFALDWVSGLIMFVAFPFIILYMVIICLLYTSSTADMTPAASAFGSASVLPACAPTATYTA